MWGSLASSDRGQSEVLGAALLFGIVLSISVAVVVGGMTVLEQSHAQTSMQSAQVSMSELDQEIEASSGGGAVPPSGSSSFDGFSGEGDVEVRDGGWLRLLVTDNGTSIVKTNESLGKVIYERDGQRLAYQAGGVWRRSADSPSSVVVSPPGINYRADESDPTLTMPIINVTGNTSDDDFAIQRRGETESIYPSSSMANPLDGDDRVKLVVHSEFYRAWAEVLQSEVGGEVRVFDGNHTVVATLEGTQTEREIDRTGGIDAVGLDGSEVEGTNNLTIASYNSSEATDPAAVAPKEQARVTVRGNYEQNTNATILGTMFIEGDGNFTNSPTIANRTFVGGVLNAKSGSVTFEDRVYAHEKLEVQGGQSFEGDVYVGGGIRDGSDDRFRQGTFEQDLYVDGDADLGHDANDIDIEGDVYVYGEFDADDNADVSIDGNLTARSIDRGDNVDVDGAVREGGPLPNFPRESPEDWFSDHEIEPGTFAEKETAYEEEAPYGPPSGDTIDDIEDGNCESPRCHLRSGNYSIDQIVLDLEDTLVLDTSRGPINISTNGIWLANQAEIIVRGGNPVNVYNRGTYHHSSDEPLRTKAPDYHSPNFILHQRNNTTVDINGNGSFTGVIYGPGAEDTAGAEISLSKNATIYGSIVGDLASGGLSNNATILYDEALGDEYGWKNQTDYNPRDLRYLRVTRNNVRISD